MKNAKVLFIAALAAALPVSAIIAAYFPFGACNITAVFFTILGFPLIEEAAFRGTLLTFLHRYRHFQGRCCAVTAANFTVSLLFSMMHLLHHTPLWAALVFLPSLLLGYMREQTGSLRYSVILHMWFNATFIAASCLSS